MHRGVGLRLGAEFLFLFLLKFTLREEGNSEEICWLSSPPLHCPALARCLYYSA